MPSLLEINSNNINCIIKIYIYNRGVETIRTALAMGADSGIHIVTDMRLDLDLQPLAIAKILQKIMVDKKFDLAILGK